MLQSIARPVFVTACAFNVGLAVIGGLTVVNEALSLNPFPFLAGALAFITAASVGFSLLLEDKQGKHRGWIKAAIVFLVLGPVAYWFLQAPAVGDLVCLDCTVPADVQARALGDIVQAHDVMIAVALAALFCATRATTATLDELAL
jgi:hypothetical protein